LLLQRVEKKKPDCTTLEIVEGRKFHIFKFIELYH
jgi:hypothetical protein